MASSPSSSSSLPSNVEQVWQDIKLSSLSNSSISIDMNSPPEIAFHKDNISTHNACKSQQTLLTLTSMSLFHKQSHHSFLPSFNTSLSFDVLESSTIRPLDGEKMSQQHIYASSDQRHKRMIKNRESALRSRARKQETLFLHSLFGMC
ncbi:hypothetical protein SESBI_13540 [Sesbania bispinosa]|nr:hypothetical protein SESBI_13540 [Sesbania bispinosa]